MTNQLEKTNKNDVQLHIVDFLKEHLPGNYVADVQEKTKNKYSDALIHSVKAGKRSNQNVLLALVEVANENKERKEKIKLIINN
jgi:hypothetical protein